MFVLWCRPAPGCRVLAFSARIQAFTIGGSPVALASGVSPLTVAPTLRVGAVSMRCRTNLKKEKRARNRVNAFRFKKGGEWRHVLPRL